MPTSTKLRVGIFSDLRCDGIGLGWDAHVDEIKSGNFFGSPMFGWELDWDGMPTSTKLRVGIFPCTMFGSG